MSVLLIEDPLAKDRSLMLRQKVLCNGQRTGLQCEHYWGLLKKTDTVNPDAQRSGEKVRYCLVDRAEATFLGDGGSDMAVACTAFKPSRRVYDATFEDFNPMTPEDIIELERKQKAGEPLPQPVECNPIPGDPTGHLPRTLWNRIFRSAP
jgi:hypothetical protein